MKTINTTDLENIIKIRTGYEVTFETATINKWRDETDYIKLESGELKEKAGIMSYVYRTLKINNFGGGRCESEPNLFWVPVYFDYESQTGSNGIKLFDSLYNVNTGEWVVQ